MIVVRMVFLVFSADQTLANMSQFTKPSVSFRKSKSKTHVLFSSIFCGSCSLPLRKQCFTIALKKSSTQCGILFRKYTPVNKSYILLG